MAGDDDKVRMAQLKILLQAQRRISRLCAEYPHEVAIRELLLQVQRSVAELMGVNLFTGKRHDD